MAGNLAGVSPLDRLFMHVEKSESCWLWVGHVSGGYGRIRVGAERVQVHRLAYEASSGAIPDGLQLDHLCRNKLCVNPAHLEPVTPRENTLRGQAPSAVVARTGTCGHGHEMAVGNVRVRQNGKRECRACALDTRRHYRAANRDRINAAKRAAYAASVGGE